MKFLATVVGFASVASAHTLFTNLFVDGKNQGDGTCVRQPSDGSTATAPIYPVTGDVIACGRSGDKAVNYICPAPGGARLTFEFRLSPSGERTGPIDSGHKGPCGVYIKKVDDIFNDSAAGDGWFKIWEDGYHQDTDTWCTDTLIKNNGLLTVDLPTGLPSGYYLVRPEIVALHNAFNGDPQFYTSCAQVFIENGPQGPLEIPDKYQVSIPGYVDLDNPGLTYNIYEQDLPPYPIPGPDVYIPASSDKGTKQVQKDGLIPKDCLGKNANWCGKPIASYSGMTECWDGAKSCWNQAEACWNSAPPTGNGNCASWNDYCQAMNDACSAHDFEGPPKFTAKEISVAVPGPIPAPWNDIFKSTDISKGSGSSDSGETRSALVTTATTKAATKQTTKAEKTATVSATSSAEAKETEVPGYNFPGQTEDPSHTSAASPAETSTPSQGGLKVSQNGRCGGSTGQTCLGSTFGDCCSRKGRCGRKTRHCACGCQAGFGKCGE